MSKICKECCDEGMIFAEGYGYEVCPACQGEGGEAEEESAEGADDEAA